MPVILFSLLMLLGGTVGPANAAAPEPWQFNFQPAATPIITIARERSAIFRDMADFARLQPRCHK